jgi:hypothetical protein
VEVHECDGAFKKFLKKARNMALAGVNHDIHAEIADDKGLTAVSALVCVLEHDMCSAVVRDLSSDLKG